jgi:hypothetical protein
MKVNLGKYDLTSLRTPTFLLIIMVVSFAARLIYWWILVPPFHEFSGDAIFYYDAARSIAESSSYSYNGIFTAAKPPAYPIFAGLILKVFGDVNAVIFLQFLFGVLASLPIYLIARNYLDKNKASLVTLAYLVYPTTWFWESSFMSESLYVWLNNLFIFFMHRYMMKKNNLDLAAGSFWGAASFLTRPAAVFPLGIVFLSLVYQNSFKRAYKIGAIWCFIFFLVISPWIIRNYIVFNKFIPASNSAGVTIYTSYVNWGYDMSIVNFLPEDSVILASLNSEPEKNNFLLRRTFRYLWNDPLKFITVIPIKLRDFSHPFDGRWYPLSMGSKFNFFYGLLASLALLGFWWNRKAKIDLIKLSIYFIIGAVISAVIFHGEIRYRFVLNPILFLLAGLCFVDRLSSKRKKNITALILLNLIFWGIGITIP